MPTPTTAVSHMKLALAILALGAASFAATIVGLAGENDKLFGLTGYEEYYPDTPDFDADTPNQPNKVNQEKIVLGSTLSPDESDAEVALSPEYYFLSASGESEPVEILVFKLTSQYAYANVWFQSLKVKFVKQKSSAGAKNVKTGPACNLTDFILTNDAGQTWTAKINEKPAPGSAPLEFAYKKDDSIEPSSNVTYRLKAVVPKTTAAAAAQTHGCAFSAEVSPKDIIIGLPSMLSDTETAVGDAVKGQSLIALAAAPVVAWDEETSGSLTGESSQEVARLAVSNPTGSAASLTLASLPLKLETEQPSGKAQSARLFLGEPDKGKVLATVSLKPGKGWVKNKAGTFEAKIGQKINKPVTLAPGASQTFTLTLDTTGQESEVCVALRHKDLTWRLAGLRTLLRGVGVPALELTEPSCLGVGDGDADQVVDEEEDAEAE